MPEITEFPPPGSLLRCYNVTTVMNNDGDIKGAPASNQAEDRASGWWLLLIYRVPQDPPGHRAYVWRKLKELGAVYLQKAAPILPDRPRLRSALEELAARIREEFGGKVSLLETASPSSEWERDLVGCFDRDRDDEYEEIAENVERLEDEIRRERRKGRFTFAQLEDVESDWEKLSRWHDRVRARDFFGAPGRAGAEEALERGRTALDGFAEEVYVREGVREGGNENGEPDALA